MQGRSAVSRRTRNWDVGQLLGLRGLAMGASLNTGGCSGLVHLLHPGPIRGPVGLILEPIKRLLHAE